MIEDEIARLEVLKAEIARREQALARREQEVEASEAQCDARDRVAEEARRGLRGPGGWWRELRPGEDPGSQTPLIVGEHRLIFHRDLPWPGTEAYERVVRSDVRYRFVIDMASLK